MLTDLDVDTSADPADPADVSTAKSKAPSPVNYEAKYKGLNETHQKALAKITALGLQLDQLTSAHEDELATLKSTLKPLETQLNAAKALTDTLTTERDGLKGQVAAFTARVAFKAEVQEKYPNIVDLWEAGDLKDRSLFPDGEAGDKSFNEYLTRMNSITAPKAPAEAPEIPGEELSDEDQGSLFSKRGFLDGVTPRAKVAARTAGIRSVGEITKEMRALDRTSKEYATKMQALTTEMDSALG